MIFDRKIAMLLMMMLIGNIPIGFAQQFRVEGCEEVRKPLLGPTPGCDKSGAVINYSTIESGYKFKVAGVDVAATEGDELVSIVVPKKSSYIEISHPEYGTIYWKPAQKLKRKRVYQAILSSDNQKNEYKISKQWAVINIDPKDAIVKVDTTITKVKNGEMQLYLPIGKHSIEIVSPFYKSLSDTLVLDDTQVLRRRFELRPEYSYIEVRTPIQGATLVIDGVELPVGRMKSGRLAAVQYDVELRHEKYQSQRLSVELSEGDRKIVDMNLLPYGAVANVDSMPIKVAEQNPRVICDSDEKTEAVVAQRKRVKVTLTPFDGDCEVLINREVVGRGEWSGELVEGQYYFMSRRDGLESRTIYQEVKGEIPVDLKLPTPMAYYGKLNVSSNVSGAQIYLNGELVGETPLIIHNLDRAIRYDVELRKDGYKERAKSVKLTGNALTSVEIELKKNNIK